MYIPLPRTKKLFWFMDDRSELLKKIVNSELLAPSLGALASLLGYKTKSTIYRIAKGDAKSAAITTFCTLLKDRLNIDEKMLGQIGLLLQDYDYFSSRIKHEPAGRDPESVVVSMVSGDYSCYSKRFEEEELPEIIRYRHESPAGFYRMLFYYYVKKSIVSFYSKDMTYKDEIKRVLMPLANRLRQLYPENYQGKEYLEVLDNTTQYDEIAATLWNCVEAGWKMLMYYGSSYSYQDALSSFVLLPGVDERSYWLTENPEQIVMALAIEVRRKRSGFYAVFRLDLNAETLQCIGYLSFFPDGKLQVAGMNGESYKTGKYSFANHTLKIDLGHGPQPFNVGTRWELMNINTIPVISEFDKRLDDDEIHTAMLKGQGIEVMKNYEVKDVLLTRSEVRLRLVSGKELVIARNAYEFLSRIQPTDTIVVARRIKDNFEYVAWTDYNHIIPLSEFRKE